MKSEAHWQFAQRYSVARTFEGAAFLLVLGVALLWYDASEKMLLVVGLIALLAVPVYLIWRTERALKNKFPS